MLIAMTSGRQVPPGVTTSKLPSPIGHANSTPTQFLWDWSATLSPVGVAAGLVGLGPGPHSDGQVLGRRLGPMPQG